MDYKILVYCDKKLIKEYSVTFEGPVEQGSLVNVAGDLFFVNNSYPDILMVTPFNGEIKKTL